MKTRDEYAAMAERLATLAGNWTLNRGEPVTGAALATEALVYATLALAAEPGSVNESPVEGTGPDPGLILTGVSELLSGWVTDGRKDAAAVSRIGPMTLRVDVVPESFSDWQWWLDRFNAPAGAVTYRGSHCTAKGSISGPFGNIDVRLVGHGIGDLYAAETKRLKESARTDTADD